MQISMAARPADRRDVLARRSTVRAGIQKRLHARGLQVHVADQGSKAGERADRRPELPPLHDVRLREHDGSSGDADQHRAGQQVPVGQSSPPHRQGSLSVSVPGTVTETSWAPCRPVRGSWTAESATSTQGTAIDRSWPVSRTTRASGPKPVAATASGAGGEEAERRLELRRTPRRGRGRRHTAPRAGSPVTGRPARPPEPCASATPEASSSSAVSWPQGEQTSAAESAARVRQRRRQPHVAAPATLSTTSRKDSRSRLIELTC